MSQGQSGGVRRLLTGINNLTAAASLVVGGAFFALWFWLLLGAGRKTLQAASAAQAPPLHSPYKTAAPLPKDDR
jgi:hypothetical protein